MSVLENLELKRNSSIPVSQQLADYIQTNIENKRLEPGQQLPKTADIVKKVGVGNHTLKEALKILKDMGLIRTIPGKGTFVSDPLSLQEEKPEVTSRNIAIFSIFSKIRSSFKTAHPQTVDSMLTTLWSLKSRGYMVSPHINLNDYKEVSTELKSGGFDGAIWLYPQESHWPVLKKLFQKGARIVAATHYGNNYEIPSVQTDGAATCAIICDHMLSCGVEKIFIFWEAVSNNVDVDDIIISRGYWGTMMGFSVMLQARGLTNTVQIEKFLFTDEDSLYRLFVEKVKKSPVKTGVVVSNNKLFHSYFLEKPKDFIDIFSNSCLVIGTSEDQNNLLAPLSKISHFKTLISPIQTIGKSSVYKLMNIIEERFENNVTMVPEVFRDFSIM